MHVTVEIEDSVCTHIYIYMYIYILYIYIIYIYIYILVFADFDKPFLLETDAPKEGLGVVLSQKQDGGYNTVAFGSRTLTPSEQSYHSSKLEFLALKLSFTEHFK